jgi:hypothetical protein
MQMHLPVLQQHCVVLMVPRLLLPLMMPLMQSMFRQHL